MASAGYTRVPVPTSSRLPGILARNFRFFRNLKKYIHLFKSGMSVLAIDPVSFFFTLHWLHLSDWVINFDMVKQLFRRNFWFLHNNSKKKFTFFLK